MARSTAPKVLQVTGGLQIMPPVPHWYRGAMVLVGDAVHALSNSSGQSASLAIEGGIQLARCRATHPMWRPFAAYEKLRRARVPPMKVSNSGSRPEQDRCHWRALEVRDRRSWLKAIAGVVM